MSSITFLENTLSIVLSMVVPMGGAILIVHIPFLANFLRRHVIARRLMVALAGLAAFVVCVFLVPLSIENPGLFYFNIDANIWDYSALPAQANHCQFDAVTCAYIKPTPPVGLYDADMPGNSLWIILATPLLTGAISGITIWRGTDKASRGQASP